MTNIKVGDLVKRLDVIGSGTGILYRVMKIGELRSYNVMQRGARYNRRVTVDTCKVRLKPEIIIFESKLIVKRAVVSHFLCELKRVDLVDLGLEYMKLANLIRDEARVLSVEPTEGEELRSETTNDAASALREPTE